MKLKTLSASTIGQAAKCGEQLRFRLQEGPEPPGFALIRGRAVAKSIEENMVTKLGSGELLPLEHVAQIARDQVKGACEAGEVRIDFDDSEDSPSSFAGARDRTIDQAVTLASLHAREAAPTITPSAVEARVELVSPRLPVPLVGVLDLISVEQQTRLDGATDVFEAIRDAKTTGKMPSEDAPWDSDQLTTYDALYRTLRGREPGALVLDQLILPTKKIAARYKAQVALPRTTADFDAFVGRAERVHAMVEREVWIPAPEGAWWCSQRFCGYWDRCVFARGKARART